VFRRLQEEAEEKRSLFTSRNDAQGITVAVLIDMNDATAIGEVYEPSLPEKNISTLQWRRQDLAQGENNVKVAHKNIKKAMQ